MEQIKIDLVPNGVMSVAHASQFDVGRSMKFLLTDEGVTYTLAGTEVITMKLRKPDGTDDTISLVNTSSSYVEWTTVDGDLDLSGVYLAEITITSGDDVLGTANFLLKVEADPYDGANVRTVTVGPADICTFETTLPEPYPSVLVNVLATGGNGTPDNPNPINGYTEANITRCGVNLWDEEWEVGGIDINTGNLISMLDRIRTKNMIPVKGGATYYFERANIAGNIFEYDANGNFIQVISSPTSFTTTANTCFLRFYMASAYGTTYNNDISINLPDTDHDYHAYSGNTYTIAFGQTVYGGVLDVTRGKLHVTHGYVELADVNFTNFIGVSKMVYGAFPEGTKPATANDKANIICSHYKTVSRAEVGYSAPYTVTGIGIDTGGNIFVTSPDSTWASVSDAVADFSGVYMAYELATPFDIDLTPEVISAVVGTNNVFADCGETEVKYLKAGE